MPSYTYQCTQCGTELDDFRSIADRDEPGPDCCGTPTQRAFASGHSTIIFKGRNWPTQDIRRAEHGRQGRR